MHAIRPALCVALMWTMAAPAVAADAIRDVRFPAGKTETTIKGEIVGRASVTYRIGAEAGQVLSVVLKPSNAATYFNVYAPGRGPGDEALASSEVTGEMTPELNRFSGRLATSGSYSINVFLYRSAARRNERSRYQITFAIAPKVDVSAPVLNDFADGLQGGPDFWSVTTPGGGSVRMRRAPSSGAASAISVRNGAMLRNGGCRMAEGGRWCKVSLADKPAIVGWMDGRYLREGAAPGDALVPGTPYHATGEIPCARAAGQPMRPCQFGVVREGLGKATVTISTDAGPRIVRFVRGAPVSSDAIGALTFIQRADLFLITIGDERYEIPEAVVTGG